MLRVGIQESIAPELLQDFTREVDVVRIADELQADLEIDMWIAPINLKIARRQLPHFRGLRVVQSLMAGVDRLQQLLPRESPCATPRVCMTLLPPNGRSR